MRRGFVALTFALLTLAAVSTASAAGSLTIKDVDTSGFPTVRVTVQAGTDAKTPILELTENGRPAANMTISDPDAPAAIALIIDTSRTMRGQKLDDAIAAATEFVRSQSDNSLIGVYGFGKEPYTAAPISADRTQIATAIDQLAISIPQGTALHGAVLLAADDLRAAPATKRVIVLLSDGVPVRDTASATEALDATATAKAQVYPIGIQSSDTARAILTKLSEETGGTFSTAADTSALSDVYASISEQLGSTYTISYQSLVPKGSEVDLKVAAAGFGHTTQSVTAPGTPPPAQEPSGLTLPASNEGRLAIGLIAGFLVLLAATALLSAKPGVVVQKRIAPYTGQRAAAAALQAAQAAESPRISALHQLFIATEKIVGSMNWWRKVSARLEQADLPLRTAEVFYIQMGSGLFLGGFAAFVLGRRGPLALLAVAIGATLPVLFIKFKAKKRLSAFENQLPETLITMAASLKAGHAFNQAMQSVVNEGADPTAKEFARVLAEVQLGMPAEAAMDAMARRMNSYNFGFVVMAVNIQRTVGGSLADILDMVADTVRQRQQFTKKVKALTAQGRASAYVLIAMPFLMGLAIFAVNGEYMQVLWTEGLGKAMIAGGLVSMAIGSVIIKKIVDFKG